MRLSYHHEQQQEEQQSHDHHHLQLRQQQQYGRISTIIGMILLYTLCMTTSMTSKIIVTTTATTTTTTLNTKKIRSTTMSSVQQYIQPNHNQHHHPKIIHHVIPRGGGNNHHHRMKQPSQPSKKATNGAAVTTSSSPTKLPPPGTADHMSQVFNLIKTIVGAGVLGLPAGMASSFGYHRTFTSLYSIMYCCIIGLLAANGFHTIGNICRITTSTSYAQAWKQTVSNNTSYIPNIACLMVTLCTVLTYSMVLADTIPSLLYPIVQRIFSTTTTSLANHHQYILNLLSSRNHILLIVTIGILLPLCLLQSLAALAPFSLLGICGMIYTAIVMVIRCIDGTYNPNLISSSSSATNFIASLETKFRPNFTMDGISTQIGGAAILISMLSTAYMAHYNAPKFYWELSNRNASKYQAVVYQSFTIAILIMIIIACSGYNTFGMASQSLILNNYSMNDVYMSLSRWAVVLSLIFSYPLAFVGVRDGIYNMFNIPDHHRTQTKSNIITVILLSIITFIASIMKDIRIVLSLGGATWGNLLSYVFPAFMIVGLTNKKNSPYASNKSNDPYYPSQNDVRIAIITAILGIGMGIIGTAKAIQAM